MDPLITHPTKSTDPPKEGRATARDNVLSSLVALEKELSGTSKAVIVPEIQRFGAWLEQELADVNQADGEADEASNGTVGGSASLLSSGINLAKTCLGSARALTRAHLAQTNMRAAPRHATPRHVTPCHATPRHATCTGPASSRCRTRLEDAGCCGVSRSRSSRGQWPERFFFPCTPSACWHRNPNGKKRETRARLPLASSCLARLR